MKVDDENENWSPITNAITSKAEEERTPDEEWDEML